MESFLPFSWAVRRAPPELAKDYALLSMITLLAVPFTRLEEFLEKEAMVFRSALA